MLDQRWELEPSLQVEDLRSAAAALTLLQASDPDGTGGAFHERVPFSDPGRALLGGFMQSSSLARGILPGDPASSDLAKILAFTP